MTTLSYRRLAQPEPYRATGHNTLRAPVVTVVLKPKGKKRRLNRRVIVNG